LELKKRRHPSEAGERAAHAKAVRATAGDLADVRGAAGAKEAIERTAAREELEVNMTELVERVFCLACT
jgi:predicted ATPase with chaperone activity